MTNNQNTHDLTSAEAAAQAAAQQETDLERRVLDGDDDVTAEELETAAAGSRFARLRATAARNRKAKAEREARQAAEKGIRDEWAKIDAAGTAAPARSKEAAEQLAREVTAAVEKFADTLADRQAVADGLMAQARATGAPVIQPSDRTTERGPIYIANYLDGQRLMIDGEQTTSTGAAGVMLDRLLREYVTEPAKNVNVLGRRLGNW